MADAPAAANDASLSFLEKQQELAFEMDKESNTHQITEADAVDNLAKSEVGDSSAATQSSTDKATAAATTTTTTTENTEQQQQQQTQNVAAASAVSTKESEKKDSKDSKDSTKPMEWEDAMLVEDLTIERASADANTRYIGANMKTSKVGQPKAASFLQMGPPMYYYPVHPAFLQQAQRMHAQQQQQAASEATEGRSKEGAQARTQGWGDYGTPLYYAGQFGSYDGLGAAGANMYGNYGYAPYASGYAPPLGGPGGFPPDPYFSPYGSYAPFSPPAPPAMPTDLPLPPWIQTAGRS
jgi:hypothetical protein